MTKYTKFILYSLIIILGYTNLHLAYNNATTGQITTNPAIIRADENLGSGIATPVFFKVVGGTILSVTNGTYGFRVPSLTNCNTIDTDGDGDFACGVDGGGGGGTQIELQNSGADLGNFSSISFDASHFTVTDTTGEALVKLDWTTGPASKAAINLFTAASNQFSNTLEIKTASVSSLTIAGLTQSGTNTGDVTLAGTPDYITISGQIITRGTIDISDDTNLTAGDALTLTGDDIDFDGGATPGGDLGNTWADPQVDNDSHDHTGTTLSGIDISDDTNLTAGDHITRTDDDLDIDDDYLFNTGDTATGLIQFSLGASVTAGNFEVRGISSASFFNGSAFSAVGDCNDPGDTLNWDVGVFSCGTDSEGGGGGGSFPGLEIKEPSGDVKLNGIASLSFEGNNFNITASDSTDVRIRLDWGAGGPASLSEAETITGNWVNTANPWADNEVADNLTINGGTVTWTDLTSYPTGCTDQFVTTVGDTLTCASVDISAMTNLTAGTDLTLTGDDLTLDSTLTQNFTLNAAGTALIVTNNARFGTASVSTIFEATTYASSSKFLGNAFVSVPNNECSGADDTLNWENGVFTCGSDGGGGSSFFLDIGDSAGVYHQTSSITYDAGHFTTTYGSPIASGSYVRLDWDSAGGPASLSQAETITGNWVNTANPWADNEVADILTLTGSTITGGNNVRDTLTTTANLTIGDNGDAIIVSATNWDLDTNGLLINTSASHSYGEFTVYASASAYIGTAFASVGDCNDAGENLQWTTTGVFNCATGYYHSGGTDVALADGGTGATLADPNDDRLFMWDDSAGATVLMDLGAKLTTTATPLLTISSNSLNFGELQGALLLDSNITTSSASYNWNFGDVNVNTGSGSWDFGGASQFRIPSGTITALASISEMFFDTTDGVLVIRTATESIVFGDDIHQAFFTIYDDGNWASESISIWQAPKDMAVTIVQVDATAFSAGRVGSVSFYLEERGFGTLHNVGTKIMNASSSIDFDGVSVTLFNDAQVAASAHVLLKTGGPNSNGDGNDTVNYITGTIYYKKKVE